MSAPTITIDSLRRRKSGVTGDNLGGAMHASEISNNVVNNFFRKITETEAQTGVTIYRGFYLINTHSTETMKNIILYFGTPVTNSSIEVSFGHGTSAIGSTSVEQTIPNEFTAPTVRNNKWYVNPGDRIDGIPVDGDLAPGQHAFIWMRMVVPSGTQSSIFTHYRMKVEMFNPAAADNIPEDWSMIVAGNFNCGTNSTDATYQMLLRMFRRDFVWLQTAGNNTVSTSDATCFINMLKSTGMRPKTKIAIGERDGDTITTNALRSEFGLPSDINYSYDIYNVHVTVMKYESEYSNTGTTFNWVKQDLEGARNRPGIDWLIVVVNDNFYMADLADGQPNQQADKRTLRNAYHPLFMANSVHLVLSAGSYMYSRTGLCKYFDDGTTSSNPQLVQEDQGDNYTWYNKGFVDGASLFMCVGSVGNQARDVGLAVPPDTPFMKMFGDLRDYIVLQFSNFGNKLNILRYNVSDQIGDRVTMEHVLPP